MFRHVGTRHTPAQAWNLWRRTQRYVALREQHELETWLQAIKQP